jgi:oxygen-independent coproporphyrinogen III oxidase
MNGAGTGTSGTGTGIVGAATQDGRRRVAAVLGGPRHLYVHIPFCRERCDYCEFVSQAVGESDDAAGRFGRFIAAVHAEWAHERARWDVRRLETVYVGGGTPSLLGQERLERLLEPLVPLLTPRAEVTIEANPEDVTPSFAAWAAARRVRVSLGVQSFSARLRETLGRRAAADPVVAFRALRDAGVADLGLDLIFGIPGQTAAGLEREFDAVAALRPDHVSWYELTVAEGTMLAARLALTDAGRLGWDAPEVPDADLQAEMYRRIVVRLERLGYRWYETSSFAQARHRARHNLAYWRGRDYLGLGPSAVSTVGSERWRNGDDVSQYTAYWRGAAPECVPRSDVASESGSPRVVTPTPLTPLSPPCEIEHLDAATRVRERLMLAGRTGEPVPLAELEAVLDRDALESLGAAGFVSLGGGTLRLTRKGRYVADEVCVRLFRVDSFQGAK